MFYNRIMIKLFVKRFHFKSQLNINPIICMKNELLNISSTISRITWFLQLLPFEDVLSKILFINIQLFCMKSYSIIKIRYFFTAKDFSDYLETNAIMDITQNIKYNNGYIIVTCFPGHFIFDYPVFACGIITTRIQGIQK